MLATRSCTLNDTLGANEVEIEDLGVIADDKLKFICYINNIVFNASARAKLIKNIFYHVILIPRLIPSTYTSGCIPLIRDVLLVTIDNVDVEDFEIRVGSCMNMR